ncbi:hypothetical protein [Leeuwenhoekiella sp. MAR_2009_132]|uniref:hypothetical protein n=1 Tax=Leeuwenhoekiella sp. MAR_2009_132 TaxID=1392489 RepID=UPI00049165CD|nr:hypothetical protein [Leeuwenhoekiella sp. MAR_2009_132]
MAPYSQQHQKANLFYRYFLVISVFLILIQTSCGSIKNSKSNNFNIKSLIALEVNFHEADNIRFIDTFSNSKAFKSYLKDYMFEKEPKLSYPNPFYSKSQAIAMFKGSNGTYLINQLNQSDGSLEKYFPKQKINLLFKYDDGENNQNRNFEYKSRKQIKITKPVISMDGKLALIWYSTYFIGDGHTGIHIFEKIDGIWVLSNVRELY